MNARTNPNAKNQRALSTAELPVDQFSFSKLYAVTIHNSAGAQVLIVQRLLHIYRKFQKMVSIFHINCKLQN